MRDYIKKTQYNTIILFCINFIILLVTFGVLVFSKHYSSDDFSCYYCQFDEAKAVIFSSYRIFLGSVYYLLDLLNINVVANQIFFGLLMLVCFAISCTIVTCELMRSMSDQNICNHKLLIYAINAGSLMLILNVFTTEWVWFSLGYIQWGGGILSATYAAVLFSRKNDRISNYILVYLMLFIAAGCYQITLAIYVFIVMTLIMIKTKEKLGVQPILELVKAAFLAVTAIGVNIFVTKVLVYMGYGYSSTRASSQLNYSLITNNVERLLNSFSDIMVTGFGFLPKYFFIFFLIIYLYFIINGIYTRGKKYSIVFLVLSIIGGLAVMAFSTLIADIFWLPARMIVPSIGVFAVLHWMSLYNRTDACKSLIVVAMLGTMFLVAQFFGIQAQEVDCIKTIAVEENEIKTIAHFIENYEHNSGNTINKVAFIHDMAPTYKYYNIISNDRYYGEMQTRSILVDWSDIQLLNFYSGRSFVKIVPDATIQSQFNHENFDLFNPGQQIRFADDIAYICIY